MRAIHTIALLPVITVLTGLQVNYGRRFLDGNKLALYGEINFLASPLRDVSSSVTSATQTSPVSMSRPVLDVEP
jgi:hypothetical protein